ncbi:MAG: DNA repair protein RecO [Candidatus Omnitrophica bacterium]|nr:DNA repair protein RecO [Candidatus Omnitrophota bacterium]
MGIHTAEAIVLRRYPFRETSITLTCLTDQFGKLKGLVKGIRTVPNRYRSMMESLTINRIVFYDTHSSQLHLISQCDLLNPLAELQRDLSMACLAALCAELTDAVTPIGDPQPQLYYLLKQTLERLALGGADLTATRVHFVARLLRLVGFQPQLNECIGCGSRVEQSGFWSIGQGGLICPRCLHEDPNAEPASPSMLETLAALSDAAQPIAMEQSLACALQQRLDEFLRWRLERPLKSLIRGQGAGGRGQENQRHVPCPMSHVPKRLA